MPLKPPADATQRSMAGSIAAIWPAGRAADRRARVDRRRHSAWSFLYGGVRPRRRQGRRDGDHNRTFPDWHEPRVLYLALGIVLMSCADALFTLNLLAAGGQELNVVMRMLLASDVEHFLWAKIGVTGLSVIPLVIAARRHVLGWLRVERFLQFFCAGYAALMVYEIYLLGWHATDLAAESVDTLLLWVAG
jgi:hypothetical protein